MISRTVDFHAFFVQCQIFSPKQLLIGEKKKEKTLSWTHTHTPLQKTEEFEIFQHALNSEE